MRAIFISYRRDDAEGQAGRLFADLAAHFGDDAVFMDVTGLEPGRDFRRAIDQQVTSCGVLLAMIGKGWVDAKDESGRRRLDDPMDFVRLETASALKRDIPVIPVLVHGASMPRAEQLPPDLAELVYRNAIELTHARWASDVQVLIKALRPHVEGAVRPSDETGVTSPTPGAIEQPSTRRLPQLVGALLAAIAVAVGGYVAYEKLTGNGETAGKTEAGSVLHQKEVKGVTGEQEARPPSPGKDVNALPVARDESPPVSARAAAQGLIYAVMDNGDLRWNRHDGRDDGTFRWATGEGKVVGTGWNVPHVFSGGDGVIYAVMDNGDLKWNRHDGRGDGTFRWAAGEGKVVGSGWNVQHVFSGGDGIIYAVTDNGDLKWYRHDGRDDGTPRWAATGTGEVVGSGWNVKHAFSN